MNALVPIQSTNAEVYRASTDAATLCKEIVLASAMEIQKRKYVKVEGWQAIAIAHGCTGSAREVERVEGGVRAIGEVRRMSDGAVIAEAEGFVGEDEPTWFGGESETWEWGEKRGERKRVVKTLPKRPDYAIRAMAQTRAISRACRSAFAHVVVMMNAGLSTTPAEEVPMGGFDEEPRNVTPKAHAAGPTVAEPPAEMWRTLSEEMDACRSVEELEAWDRRRGRDIGALPKPQHTALGKKYQLMAETLPAKLAASTDQSLSEHDLAA
jgi:hypothetical protein